MICRYWMAFKVLGTDDNHSFASVMRMSQKQLCDPIPWFKQPASNEDVHTPQGEVWSR